MDRLKLSLVTLFAVLSFATAASAQSRGLASPTARVHLEIDDHDDAAGRVGAQIGATFATYGVGALVGGIVGAASTHACDGSWLCLSDGPVLMGFAGAMLGIAASELLVPLVITGAGELNGGRGNAGAAYLGFLVGGGAGVGLIALGSWANSALGGEAGGAILGTSIVLGSALLIAGPIVGYAIWDANARASGPSVRPTFAASPDGVSIGAAGTF